MNNDIEEILDRFDRVLKNYEIDKRIGNLSVDSIYHLFPNETITIKNYITNLQEENKRLKEIVYNLTTLTVNGDRKQIKNTAQYKLEQCQQRIDKTIERLNTITDEYHEKQIMDCFYKEYAIKEIHNALSILRGEQ